MPREMKSYVGTKVINGTAMNRQDYNDFRGWALPDDEDGNDTGYLVEYVNGGKANTCEFEGYVSWSPEEIFDGAYNESGEMTFGDATLMAEQGIKVSRKGWAGSDLYLMIMRGYPEGVPANEATAEAHGVEIGSIIKIRPYWVIVNPKGEVSTWAPSGSDSLAKDWGIYSPLTFADKLENEAAQLQDNISKLQVFQATAFDTLDDTNKFLLGTQVRCMKALQAVLDSRISNLNRN